MDFNTDLRFFIYISLVFLDSEQSIPNKSKTDKNNSFNNLKDKSIK